MGIGRLIYAGADDNAPTLTKQFVKTCDDLHRQCVPSHGHTDLRREHELH